MPDRGERKQIEHKLRVKFARFATVGVANTIIYATATAVYISGLGIGDKMASVLGYCTAVPFAFLAHRAYTFSSRGLIRSELLRFAITQGTSLLVSVFAMRVAVDYLGLHYALGILGGAVLVPIVTFIVLNKWVFRNQPKFEI